MVNETNWGDPETPEEKQRFDLSMAAGDVCQLITSGSWIEGAEYDIWALVQDEEPLDSIMTPDEFTDVDELEGLLDILRTLSSETSLWPTEGYGHQEEYFVDLEEWRKMYAAERAEKERREEEFRVRRALGGQAARSKFFG